jgi:subtilisin family serine protease
MSRLYKSSILAYFAGERDGAKGRLDKCQCRRVLLLETDMNRLRLLAAITLIFTTFAGVARAGELDPQLQTLAAGKSADDLVQVWITLDDNRNSEQFKQSIVSRAATRAEQNRLAITELKQEAKRQQPLLDELEQMRVARRVSSYKGHWIANVVEAEVRVSELETLAARSDVVAIYAAPEIVPVPAVVGGTASPQPADASMVQGNIQHVNAPAAWAAGYTGEGRLVCTFDTGVLGSHEALSDSWKGKNGDSAAGWFDQVDTLKYPHILPASMNYHGTHTLGIIVGHAGSDTIGVAPGAKWISAGVIGLSKTSILDAFEWAANPDGDLNTIDDVPDVINHSWYFTGFPQCANAVYDAVDNTEALGIVNIFSAGNSGGSAGDHTITNPAARALTSIDCFAVGNLNTTVSPAAIAATSSKGPSPCDLTKIKPNVVAPGTSIRSSYSDGGYNTLSGTSQAAPHVAGLVALLRQKNPNATVDEIKTAIQSHTQAVGTGALPNNTFGYGEIDCLAALNALPVESDKAIRIYDFSHRPIAPGDTVVGTVVLKNLGANTSNVHATITGTNASLTILDGSLTFGTIAREDTVRSADSIRVIVSDTVTEGTTLAISLTIAGTSYSTVTQLYFQVGNRLERSIATHNLGRIQFTVSNFGALGLGDPSIFKLDGAGFKFGGGSNFLWEGGIIVGTGMTKISSSVHEMYSEPRRDFVIAPGGNLTLETPGSIADQQTHAVFDDSHAESPLGLTITQESFAFDAPNDDFIIMRYILENQSGSTLSNLRLGLFLDWDVVTYSQNAGGYESTDSFVWMARNSSGTKTNYRGARLIQGTMATAGAAASAGYYCCESDGFTSLEKYQLLTSGLTYAETNKNATTDLCMIVAAGPMTIPSGGKDTVTFAILAGATFADIQDAAARADTAFSDVEEPEEPPIELPASFVLHQNYPNPFNPGTVIPFDVPRRSEYTLEIFNVLGQAVHKVSGIAEPGQTELPWDGSRYSSGVYLYRVTLGNESSSRKMLLLK